MKTHFDLVHLKASREYPSVSFKGALHTLAPASTLTIRLGRQALLCHHASSVVLCIQCIHGHG